MEWLKKLLEAQGLSEAQIKTITEGVTTNYTGYVPPYRFEIVNTARKTAARTLKARDKQLEELQKALSNEAALKEQIAQLQADNRSASEKFEADLNDLRLSMALKSSLAGKVHDLDIVAGLLDKNKIELDDVGSVKGGLDDQLEALQVSKAFLFVTDSGVKPRFKSASRRKRRKIGRGKRSLF
ncbi:phage scaffolding protein [Cohnella faecalis]|nr:phage scaffolding protein [Cohnella faecalis]